MRATDEEVLEFEALLKSHAAPSQPRVQPAKESSSSSVATPGFAAAARASVADSYEGAAGIEPDEADPELTAYQYAVRLFEAKGMTDCVDASRSGPRIKKPAWLVLSDAERKTFKRLLERDRKRSHITEEHFVVNQLPPEGSRSYRRLKHRPGFSEILAGKTPPDMPVAIGARGPGVKSKAAGSSAVGYERQERRAREGELSPRSDDRRRGDTGRRSRSRSRSRND